MIKVQNEASTGPQDQELWLSTGAAEPALAPALVVTYTDPAAQTYEAPATPKVSAAKSAYTTQVTVTNPTAAAWGTNWQLGYHWVDSDGTTLVSTPATPVYTALPATLNPGSQATLAETVAPRTRSRYRQHLVGVPAGLGQYNAAAGTWLSRARRPRTWPYRRTHHPIPGGASLLGRRDRRDLGLEKYFQYLAMATGSGSELDDDDANGNACGTTDRSATRPTGSARSCGWNDPNFEKPGSAAGCWLIVVYFGVAAAAVAVDNSPATRIARIATAVGIPNFTPASFYANGLLREMAWSMRPR